MSLCVCVIGPAARHSLSSWEAPLGPQSFLAALSASDFLPTWLSHLGLSGQVSMPAPGGQGHQLLAMWGHSWWGAMQAMHCHNQAHTPGPAGAGCSLLLT